MDMIEINSFCFFMFILARPGKLARILSHLNHSFTCRAYILYRRIPSMDMIEINSFCFFMFILARRGKLARFLSHLNQSFTCRAYVLYRRLPSMDTIDISVVIVSEFLDEDEKDIRELRDHIDAGFVPDEKGMLKRVHTDRSFEMSLDFPGVETIPFFFELDQPELDSVGFAIDHFKKIAVQSPAQGIVKICEVHRSGESKLLWELCICEMEEEITMETHTGKRNYTAIF